VNVMEVDVILPLYQGRRWIGEAIDSVLAQTYPHWHLTIVDDCSPDDTLDYIKEAYKHEDARISFLRLAERLGPGGARMEAIRRTHGDAIAFIDQDDRWHPQKLEYQLERAKLEPMVQAIHADVQHIDSRGQVLHRSADRENTRRRRIPYDRLEPDELKRHLFLHPTSIRLVSALVLRRPFELVGGFDGTLFGAEDWEFWVRFSALGYHVAHLATPLIERRLHPGNTSNKPVWKEWHWRATDKVLLAYPDLAELAPRRKASLLRGEIVEALVAGSGRHVRQRARQLVRLMPIDLRGYRLLLLCWISPLPRPLLAICFPRRTKLTMVRPSVRNMLQLWRRLRSAVSQAVRRRRGGKVPLD
jgi:glycosyltransferase involved in cell wall biosynthesis